MKKLKKKEGCMKDELETIVSSIKGGAVKNHPVKLTALLYLKEALLEERFEDCKELISIAKEFGAKSFEIENLIEDPRREVT